MQKQKKQERSVKYREIILNRLLKSGLFLVLLAIIPAVMLSLRTGIYKLLFFDLFLAVIFIFICSSKKISYNQKVSGIISVTYLVGVNIVVFIGFVSGAPAWFFTVPVLAALLIGFKASLYALLANTLTLIILGWLMNEGIIAQGMPFYRSTINAVSAFANFTVLNAAVSFSVAALVTVLEKSLAEKDAAEAELAQKENMYRMITENINEVIWITDESLNITYISPSVENLTGLMPADITGKNIVSFRNDPALGKAARMIGDKLTEETAIPESGRKWAEISYIAPDGSEKWLEIAINTLISGDGQNRGFIGIGRDITERKFNSTRQERLKRMEMLGMLAGGVAHELNNILAGIVGYPDLILMDITQKDPHYKMVRQIKKSGEKAADIVNDMLLLSGRRSQKSEEVRADAIIKSFLDSSVREKISAEYPGAVISETIEPEIRPIMAPPVPLVKSIENLAVNSLESGSETIEISAGNRTINEPEQTRYGTIPPGSYVYIEIKDKGKGFKDSDLEHIFEPFYTKKVMKQNVTGLEMPVVWSTVKECRGFIDIKSLRGEGTTVSLYFPPASGIEVILHDNAGGQHGSSGPAGTEKNGKGKKILVVDDIESQRILAEKVLSKHGYNVYMAESGENAVELAGREKFDLVLLDMIMEGGMDGLDTYRKLRKINPLQKAIIVSGYAESERAKAMIEEGALGYIHKPYTVEKIISGVKKALEA